MKLFCQVMGASRSRPYGYEKAHHREPDPEQEEKRAWVKVLDEGSDHTYGSRRMAEGLRTLAYSVGRYQARRLMKEAGLLTTDSDHQQPVYPNRLAQDFQPRAPNRVWASDRTSVRTREGRLYPAVVIHSLLRSQISLTGWSISTSYQNILCLVTTSFIYQIVHVDCLSNTLDQMRKCYMQYQKVLIDHPFFHYY